MSNNTADGFFCSVGQRGGPHLSPCPRLKQAMPLTHSLVRSLAHQVVLTTVLVDCMIDIFSAKVPKSWLYTAGGDEFSWLLPSLGRFGSVGRSVSRSFSGKPVAHKISTALNGNQLSR